jgi:tetratricopeptide (TPR) repeat protein
MQNKHNHVILKNLQQAHRFQQSGNILAAERKYRSILKAQPQHSDALQHLAILLHRSGKASSALHFMLLAHKHAPKNVQILINLAEIYRALLDVENTLFFAQQALYIQNTNPDALAIMGAVYYQINRLDEARAYFDKSLASKADDESVRMEYANVCCSLASLEEKKSHTNEAIQHYRQALEKKPNHIPALLNTGRLLLIQHADEAAGYFTQLLKIQPNHVEALYYSGVQAQSMGDFDRAEQYFLQVLGLQPDYHKAWHSLSINQNFKPDTQQIERLEKHFLELQINNTDQNASISLSFTLARFFEKKDRPGKAFYYLQQGNRLKADQLNFDQTQHSQQIQHIIDTFDVGFFQQRKNWGNSSQLPVFIVGMPRSGTSLLEQIISSHPQIHGAGELNYMQQLINNLPITSSKSSNSHATRVASLSHQQVDELATLYLTKLQALAPNAERVTDKLPGNYSRLGLIRLLFPRAIIIHCRRNAMDTCWSCFKQNFEQGQSFSYDLADLAHCYLEYQRMMAHWKKLFGDQILDIDYEELLKEPEQQARRILQHCGVEWDAGVLEFHQQQRPVSSASKWQVRQPLYQSSVGSWQKYREYLSPLINKLTEK